MFGLEYISKDLESLRAVEVGGVGRQQCVRSICFGCSGFVLFCLGSSLFSRDGPCWSLFWFSLALLSKLLTYQEKKDHCRVRSNAKIKPSYKSFFNLHFKYIPLSHRILNICNLIIERIKGITVSQPISMVSDVYIPLSHIPFHFFCSLKKSTFFLFKNQLPSKMLSNTNG